MCSGEPGLRELNLFQIMVQIAQVLHLFKSPPLKVSVDVFCERCSVLCCLSMQLWVV
jgi:hypothetical protein